MRRKMGKWERPEAKENVVPVILNEKTDKNRGFKYFHLREKKS